MTYTDWRDDVSLAAELKKILDLPIMKQALSVVDGLTAAKVLGNTNALVASANNAHVLFGFDAGRASVIDDLIRLSVVPEEIENINPTYQGGF